MAITLPASQVGAQQPARPDVAGTAVAARAHATVHRTYTAAGSVVVLGDGAVVRASYASIQPPAPGFVYER